MTNSRTPYTDLLSQNQSNAVVATAVVAPALTPEQEVQLGAAVVVAGGVLSTLVDSGANVGDVFTLTNPSTGDGEWAPGGGGEVTYDHEETLVFPGSGTVPDVITITHNQGAFPKDVRVYIKDTNGNYIPQSDIYLAGSDHQNWTTTVFPQNMNTLNVFQVAYYQRQQESNPGFSDVKVTLVF